MTECIEHLKKTTGSTEDVVNAGDFISDIIDSTDELERPASKQRKRLIPKGLDLESVFRQSPRYADLQRQINDALDASSTKPAPRPVKTRPATTLGYQVCVLYLRRLKRAMGNKL